MIPVPTSQLTPSRISQMVGLGSAASLTVLAMVMGGMGIGPFLDLPSAIIVAGGTGGLLLASFGLNGTAYAVRTVLGGGGTNAEIAHATAWCVAAAAYAIGSGAVGAAIGLVQALQMMSDPTQVGPALALCLLTQLYGICAALPAVAGALSVARREPTGTALEGTAVVSAAAITVASVVGFTTFIASFSLVFATV